MTTYERVDPDEVTQALGAQTLFCSRCMKHPATHTWTGDGGALAAVHGLGAPWCEWCVLDAQLKHCREAADRIAGLEARLAELNGTTITEADCTCRAEPLALCPFHHKGQR